MTALRVAWKLLAIAIFCCATIVSLTTERLLGRLRPKGRIERENRIIRRWASRVAAVMQIHVTTEGPIPSPPFLLVSNHLSYTDVLVLMSQIDARLLAKSELRSWPVLGWLASFCGTLFIDRNMRADIPRVLGEINEALAQGRGIVIFPEGTSSAGLRVMPFKAPLFEVATRGDYEVVTAALRYSTGPRDRPAQWSVCWWSDMSFPSHMLGLLQVSHIDAHVRFGETRLRGNDRKELALAAAREVERLFEPVCTELGQDLPGMRT